MKYITIVFTLFLIIGCGDTSKEIDEAKLEMDVDRLCSVVASTPRYQARSEYVKGYYNILDKYGLSQDSETIQETFDGMTELLAMGSFCKIKTLSAIRKAI